MVGWLDPRTPEDSPITRRYALGGPDSQRGFSLGHLSPESHPTAVEPIPLGGNGAVLGSFEARVRVVKLFDYWLDTVTFVDAGDVEPFFRQLDLKDLHVAVGTSLAYETPIGAVRMGLGVRVNRLGISGPNGLPNPDPHQPVAFHLTVGQAF